MNNTNTTDANRNQPCTMEELAARLDNGDYDCTPRNQPCTMEELAARYTAGEYNTDSE